MSVNEGQAQEGAPNGSVENTQMQDASKQQDTSKPQENVQVSNPMLAVAQDYNKAYVAKQEADTQIKKQDDELKAFGRSILDFERHFGMIDNLDPADYLMKQTDGKPMVDKIKASHVLFLKNYHSLSKKPTEEELNQLDADLLSKTPEVLEMMVEQAKKDMQEKKLAQAKTSTSVTAKNNPHLGTVGDIVRKKQDEYHANFLKSKGV